LGGFPLAYPDGSRVLESLYKDGKEQGLYNSWYDNGLKSNRRGPEWPLADCMLELPKVPATFPAL